jgi:hypothetical protein
VLGRLRPATTYPDDGGWSLVLLLRGIQPVWLSDAGLFSRVCSLPQWGSSCLLASVPVFGRPPSLLTGSRRFSVPRFSIGTMQSLRLPTHPLWLESISPRSPEVSTLFSWLPPVADRLSGGVDVLDRGRPFPGWVLWCGTGIPCFMVSLLMVCPALRPRPCPRTSLCGPRILPPLSQRRRPTGISFISWLYNTAFHLAVYASCRLLGRRRKTRLRCDATRFPAGDDPAWVTLRHFTPAFSPQVLAL